MSETGEHFMIDIGMPLRAARLGPGQGVAGPASRATVPIVPLGDGSCWQDPASALGIVLL
jgi:hypothetical protein